MSFILIVNADDFNYSPGVSRGILKAHDSGIVRSTTILINLPLARIWSRELKRRKNLGVGLHLNVSFGQPVSDPREVPSLVDRQGDFRLDVRGQTPTLQGSDPFRTIRAAELRREYENQVERFRTVLGCDPTHLDTHHHLHENKKILPVVSDLAIRLNVPIRLSGGVRREIRRRFAEHSIPLADSLLGDPAGPKPWQERELLRAVASVRKGVHEIFCHPGYADRRLKAISDFAEGREEELRLFTSRRVKREIETRGIRLAHYGELHV